jgi:signal transduction histidine kinase
MTTSSNIQINEIQKNGWQEEDLFRMNQVLRHRIRNFVSGLKAGISFLEQELKSKLSASQLEYFPLINRECEEMAECTDRMNLLFDTLPQSESDTFINLLSALLEKIRRKFPALEITFDLPEEAASIIILQKACVSVAIEEAVINAAEAAPGTPIKINLTKNINTVVIHITDEGKKTFTSEEMERFFLPFFTTKPRHLGLGLAIARRFIAHCGGSIKLLPNEDRNGAMLEIVLPLQASITQSSA